MKCSGCGANFSSRLKACPYCGTVNNEALLREHITPEIPGMWEPTDSWNREFSNDRIWS